MQLVIIAGGQGTRLKERIADLPKPMVEIGGKPLLEHQILLARKHRIEDILMLTGFGAEHIESYFGDGAKWGVRIAYHREPRPLGTAGAALNAFGKLDRTFMVMYGDTMLNIDLRRMMAAHPPDALASLFLHPNDHPQDSDLVEVDDTNRIAALHPYPHPPDSYFGNLVNAALYIVDRSALPDDAQTGSFDFAKHLFPALIASGAKLRGYVSREYIKDAGTPKRLDRVRHDYASGWIQAGSFETPVPAIFLDRDGTLNHERGWLNAADQMDLLPGAAEAVRTINEASRLAVLITNQPGIARGECTEAQLKIIHNKLEWQLGESQAYLDGIYFCPHHPDAGFPGERADLKIACNCRKPEIGLLRQAARDLNADVSRSWMIGDRASDIHAAAKFGIRSALVRTGPLGGSAAQSCQPDGVFDTVLEATNFILSEQLVRA
ncbi:MAG: HAD-IIIA family hydrolase [Acidobacteriota bacterium]|nr:HAD-IIIA family hydrolase [Acidobacteriota bacterium]